MKKHKTLEELKYIKFRFEWMAKEDICYVQTDHWGKPIERLYILFQVNVQFCEIVTGFDMELHMAIHNKLKELGWV